jgi:hypothetical protein
MVGGGSGSGQKADDDSAEVTGAVQAYVIAQQKGDPVCSRGGGWRHHSGGKSRPSFTRLIKRETEGVHGFAWGHQGSG